MKNRLLLSVIALLLVFNLALGLKVYSSLAAVDDEDSAYANINVLTRAMQLIRRDYVDADKVTYRELTYNALRGMLDSLDPHSQFLEPDAFRGMQDDTRSRFGGLGVVVSMKDGLLTVVAPMEDTPGSRAGLLPGDQILKIGEEPTEKMNLGDAVNLLRGEPGEPVTITIYRPATQEVEEHELVREIIRVQSVRDARILNSERSAPYKIGYVRIAQFSEPTARELGEKLDQLAEEGAEALVLDLRNNPGGLLSSAVEVCGQFVGPNQTVVYTEGRQASQDSSFSTPRNAKQRTKVPLAILINRGSASGSEIVAGALRDLGEAILVGETTFGKGSVQSVLGLPDGSAMKMTTAAYYTPGRESIDENGVKPNILVTNTREQERARMLRRDFHLLSEEEKAELGDVGDPQLDRAVDALVGALIYQSRRVEN